MKEPLEGSQMTHKSIIVDFKKCNGCRICEVFCSKKHEGKILSRMSRIRVFPYFPGLDIATVCYQCEKPKCAEICPVNAIKRDDKTGIVSIDDKLCTGCVTCIQACPAKAVFLHPTKKIAIKCDFCDGEPECVKHCPEQAIEFRLTPFDARLPPEGIAKDLAALMLEKHE
jgi:carbon-monoxide dehydrogenase iron sulfur subunit